LNSIDHFQSRDLFIRCRKCGIHPAEIFLTSEFRQLFLFDFKALDNSPVNASNFFSFPLVDISSFELGSFLMSYEIVLKLLKENFEGKYNVIHKGTPFYFLSMGSFLTGDFEKAVYYMDAAFKEDIRSEIDLKETPAGLFFDLNTENEKQAGLEIVKSIKRNMDYKLKEIEKLGGPTLSINDIKNRITLLSLKNRTDLCTVSTALLSFFYEYQSRKLLLELSKFSEGTAEPFILYWLKGCVIFESLIRNSDIGKKTRNNTHFFNLGGFLKEEKIFKALGFVKCPVNQKFNKYSDLKKYIDKKNDNEKFLEKSITVTYGIRNIVAHSLAWEDKPCLNEFEEINNFITGAICIAIDKLYDNKTESEL